MPPADAKEPWIVGSASTPAGDVPRVATELSWADRLGTWKARWGVGRMHYMVEPGLYAIGAPTPESPVLASANYKLSFDRLRSQLGAIDAWVLVLDTGGINVWCAAGKGTFGTEEIVRRVEAVHLSAVVSHRKLVVPQLGAPGVAAHEVQERSAFRVIYGPVRAEDLPAFLRAGMKATDQMRRVRFPLRDRLAVVPVELVLAAKWVVLFAACALLLAGLGADGYSWARVGREGTWSAGLMVLAFLGSTLLVPALLPWLPGRAFSTKGAWLGGAFGLVLLGGTLCGRGTIDGWLDLAGWCVLMPALASHMAMNFTGASTYTSLSGVRREVRVAVPLQLAGAAAGASLWLAGRFV